MGILKPKHEQTRTGVFIHPPRRPRFGFDSLIFIQTVLFPSSLNVYSSSKLPLKPRRDRKEGL